MYVCLITYSLTIFIQRGQSIERIEREIADRRSNREKERENNRAHEASYGGRKKTRLISWVEAMTLEGAFKEESNGRRLIRTHKFL